VTARAFPLDPEFPQLAQASDPRRMLDVFRARLRPIGRRTFHIEACVPFRFRCRQSTTRCVLQYALHLVDQDTGRRRHQWVTGLVYAGRGEAERLWHTLRGDDPRQGIPERWLTFEPVAFIPDLEMVVEVFPFDRRLPNLAQVLEEAARRVDPLLRGRLGPGRWRVLDRGLEPTRYRTELGAALRYTLLAQDARTGRTEEVVWYLKVYRDDRGAATWRVLQTFHDRARRRPAPFAVVAPIEYWRDLHTLVLEQAPGMPLQRVLLQTDDPETTLRVAARAVAAFNQDHRGIITRRQTLADQLDDLRLAAALVQWARPDLRAKAEAIRDAVVYGLTDVPPVPIHGDLKADHIFLAPGLVTFIDLDSAALGDPVRDPAHLYAYLAAGVGLDTMPLTWSLSAATVFAAEYFQHVPASWRSRFALHAAGALLEVASGVFRRQAPGWRDQVARIVALADRIRSDGR
jgi:hypothetical protein